MGGPFQKGADFGIPGFQLQDGAVIAYSRIGPLQLAHDGRQRMQGGKAARIEAQGGLELFARILQAAGLDQGFAQHHVPGHQRAGAQAFAANPDGLLETAFGAERIRHPGIARRARGTRELALELIGRISNTHESPLRQRIPGIPSGILKIPLYQSRQGDCLINKHDGDVFPYGIQEFPIGPDQAGIQLFLEDFPAPVLDPPVLYPPIEGLDQRRIRQGNVLLGFRAAQHVQQFLVHSLTFQPENWP
jgi:hypothetical protein